MVADTSFYRAQARGAATRAGIDPDVFERQIDQESGFDPNAGPSPAGACGIAQIVTESHPGINVWDPIESLNYAAAVLASAIQRYHGSYPLALASYNAGPGAVATYNWVPPYPETQRYLSIILGNGWQAKEAHMFDPQTPDEIQRQSWSCSIRSATWLLKSLGVTTDAGEMEELMLKDGVVGVDVGLLDASGHGLKDFLVTRWGMAAGSASVLTWDEATANAGRAPLALGGRAWNHWTAVRGLTADGSLALANPAPGWMGVSDVLTRADFDRLGPFAAVWIDVGGQMTVDQSAAPRFRVVGTDGQGVNVRAEPYPTAARLTGIAEGAEVSGDARSWRRVTTPDGIDGWVAADYLEAVS